MNYHNITKDDMNNGDGLRVVLWVSGCTHHCPECQNPITWDYKKGIKFDSNALVELEEELKKDYVAGITFSGGDPLAEGNVESTLAIIKWVRNNFPDKSIWVYTGYVFEEILNHKGDTYSEVLFNIDVLVDGRFIKELKDNNLKWRGSSNQRVIDVKKSLKETKVVLHCD